MKQIPGIVMIPALVVGLAALVLALAGRVPAYIQSPEGAMKEYASVEAAQADLGFEIALPAYFPDYLSWPPARIEGQREPIAMSRLAVLSSDRSTEALFLAQAWSSGKDPDIPLPWIKTTLRKFPITIGEYEGMLTVGRRGDGRLINVAQWHNSDFYFTVASIGPLSDLMAMARSIRP